MPEDRNEIAEDPRAAFDRCRAQLEDCLAAARNGKWAHPGLPEIEGTAGAYMFEILAAGLSEYAAGLESWSGDPAELVEIVGRWKDLEAKVCGSIDELCDSLEVTLGSQRDTDAP